MGNAMLWTHDLVHLIARYISQMDKDFGLMAACHLA
jgi:hypothetical protein